MLWFLRETFWIINLLVISGLIVYIINPGVVFLKKKKAPHWLAVGLVYLVFLIVIGLLFYIIVPIITAEISRLTRLLPEYKEALRPLVFQINEYIQTPQFSESLSSLIERLPSSLGELLNEATSMIFAFFSKLTEILIIMLLVFYLLKDWEEIKNGIINIVPSKHQATLIRTMEILNKKVGAYLWGNLLRCSFVGVITSLGLYFIGMPFYVSLGVFAAFMDIIYYIGPYIAAVPAVLISLSLDTPDPLTIILFYVFVQCIDSFIIAPPLLGKSVNIKPFTIIIAILVGGKLWGMLGIILAIPVIATIKVLYKEFYETKKT